MTYDVLRMDREAKGIERPNLLELTGRPKDKFIQFCLDREKASPKRISNYKFPRLACEKLDGVYGLAFKDLRSGIVTIYSRTGEIYSSMKHIEDQLSKVMFGNTLVIFEVYNPSLKQSDISGKARDTKQQHTDLYAFCHDFITLTEFTGDSDTPRPFSERLETLFNVVVNNTEIEEGSHLVFVRHIPVHSWLYAEAMAKFVWSHDKEGLVLKNPDGLYEGGARHEDLLKMKETKTYDLEVVDITEGTRSNFCKVGALVCRFKEGVLVNIGKGFSKEQRTAWFKDPSLIVGKIIEIKCMKDSDKGKLREERFIQIREDLTKGEF